MQNMIGELRFAMADYARGLESFPDRSKRRAIVYISVAALVHENNLFLSVA